MLGGSRSVHEQFADRVAERLEAVGDDPTAVRARALRLAADVALREAATVTEEEDPPPLA